VRLAEHQELRAALGVQSVPDDTTLYRFLRRLDGVVFEAALSEVSRCLLPPDEKRRATVAVDATGLTPGAISTFFHPWTNGQVERMNRTLKDATVKKYYYETHGHLKEHLHAFLMAYNFAKRLNTLKGLTPYEYLCKCW
jgi:hypothetical protein